MITRIAVFVHALAGGGAERVAVVIANELARRHYRVDLVVQHLTGPYVSDVLPDVRIVNLDCELRHLPWAFRRYLKQSKANGVLSFMTGYNVIAAFASLGIDTAVVVSEQTSLSVRNKGWSDWQRFVSPLMVPAYRRVRAVVTVSRQMLEEFRAAGVPPERLVWIPNPVADSLVEYTSDASTSKPGGASADVVVGVGRLTVQKDFETLIRAFDVVRRTWNARLLILGEGPERGRLESLVSELEIEEKVDMPGFVHPPWPLMAQASVLAMSSRWEGWPNVLMEALALGVPVVSTDCPTGPAEILDNGRFGRLVPVRDAAALAEAIIDTLDHPPNPAYLKSRTDRWSVATITDQYLNALRGGVE